MNEKHDFNTGKIHISDEVIAICASNGALNTDGVVSLWGGITENIKENILGNLGKSSNFKGIKLSQEDDTVRIDLYIIVEYGVKIPDVAWEVQENVKKEVESMTDLAVKEVNIHIQGVQIAEEVNT